MKLSRLIFYKSPMPSSFLPRRKKNGPMFDNPELNSILDKHKEEVRKNGHARLAVPKEYHFMRYENLPKSARFVAGELFKNGHKAFLCGGAVRDMAQGNTVSDYDFVTDASKEELKKVFSDIIFQQIPTGHEFGYLDIGGDIIDVCTMVNIPAGFKGVEHVPDFDPDKLYSKDLLCDAYQRDLNINALYFDAKTEEIIDYFGGLYDLREGILATPVPSDAALCCDPRIMLRALRFMARFGFSLSSELDAAVKKKGKDVLKMLSPSSVARNLPDFFAAGFAYSGVNVLLEYDLFGELFPSVRDFVHMESYREYVKRCAYTIDWIYDEGAVGLPLLSIASFLWPAVSECKKRGVKDPEETVLRSQEEIMKMSPEERAFLLSALYVDEKVDKENLIKELEAIYEDPDSYDALSVLRLYYRMNPVTLDSCS